MGSMAEISGETGSVVHSFDITVVRVSDLPLETPAALIEQLWYIRYKFPGEGSPLYTHAVRAAVTMGTICGNASFDAVAKHSTALSRDSTAEECFSAANSREVQFELWERRTAIGKSKTLVQEDKGPSDNLHAHAVLILDELVRLAKAPETAADASRPLTIVRTFHL